MKYTLTPRNEGQEMNCRIQITCSKEQVIQVALKMATDMQNALLNKADISIHIQTTSEGLRGVEGLLVTHAGDTFSLKTGARI